jgi:HSP20 family protein
MAITRYDPWNMLDQMRREMERYYEGRDESQMSTADWTPAVDVREEGDAFLISADIPGVDPKNIEIHAENGVLTLKGERESEKKEAREGFKRMERAYGSFFRRFNLPDTADTDKISAKCEYGVLHVTIPKHEKVQPRKIAVES